MQAAVEAEAVQWQAAKRQALDDITNRHNPASSRPASDTSSSRGSPSTGSSSSVRAHFSRPLLALRPPAPHPDPPARPPRLSLRAPPHRTAPPSVIPLSRLISLRNGRRLPLHPARTRHFFARYHDHAPPPRRAPRPPRATSPGSCPASVTGWMSVSPIPPARGPARPRPCPPARLASLSPFCPTALPHLA